MLIPKATRLSYPSYSRDNNLFINQKQMIMKTIYVVNCLSNDQSIFFCTSFELAKRYLHHLEVLNTTKSYAIMKCVLHDNYIFEYFFVTTE